MDVRSVRIPDSRIRQSYPAAISMLRSAEVEAPAERKPGAPAYISPVSSAPPTRKLKASLEAALRVEGDDLLPPARHAVFVAARRALALGTAAGEMFSEPLGFLDLGAKSKAGTLRGPEADRFKTMVAAKATVSLFAAAASLAAATATRPSGEPSDPGRPPLSGTQGALSWFVISLAKAVEGVGDDDLAGAVARICADVMDRLESEAPGAMGEFLPAYEACAYTVEEDGFRLRGFERPSTAGKERPLAMAFKKPSEVIGNHLAKTQAQRLAKMLVCYDFEARKNPFVELGGFIFTFIGDGFPGTGKTTLIQMTAGLVKGYCDVAGYPFRYENFGVDQISEYQGKSAQNCRAFVDRVLDPGAIGFGTIDDVDQVAGRRDDNRSSGGQGEVTAVLMDAFAGASTVVRGNCSFGMFSNYPEKVDDALRQRAGARWLVDGPQTKDDYVDLLHLLVGEQAGLPLGDHQAFAAQEIRQGDAYRAYGRPAEEKLAAVWEAFRKEHGEPRTIAQVGAYLHAIREADPRFTGRAVKNIADAVKFRAFADVELPDAWFQDPALFLRRPYAEKLAMVAALRRPVTMDMVLQEVNRYADSEFRYADKSDDAAVEALVRDARLRARAAARLGGGQ